MDKPHRKLILWQKAVELTTAIYALTDNFPQSENFGLVSQMRRAAVSIPSNIAEGAARKSSKEFLQFLYISRASLSELDTHIEIAVRVNLIEEDKRAPVDTTMLDVDRLLHGLIKSKN